MDSLRAERVEFIALARELLEDIDQFEMESDLAEIAARIARGVNNSATSADTESMVTFTVGHISFDMGAFIQKTGRDEDEPLAA